MVVWLGAFAQANTPTLPRPTLGFRQEVQALYSQLGSKHTQFVLDTAGLSDTLWAPLGSVSHRLEREKNARWKSHELVAINWLDVSGKRLRRELRPVRTIRKEWVGCVRERKVRGQQLDSAELDWSWQETSAERDSAVTVTQLSRLRLRRTLNEGQMVRSASLEACPRFLKGAMVLLMAGQGNTHIQTEVELLEDAYEGHRVRCRGPFGQEIKATLDSDGILRGP